MESTPPAGTLPARTPKKASVAAIAERSWGSPARSTADSDSGQSGWTPGQGRWVPNPAACVARYGSQLATGVVPLGPEKEPIPPWCGRLAQSW